MKFWQIVLVSGVMLALGFAPGLVLLALLLVQMDKKDKKPSL